VTEPRRGYGSAYLAGLEAARGDVLVLADADGTYPLDDLDRLLGPIREGADLVLGSRLKGTLHPRSMPWLHRWIGNPILTGMLNLFFGAGVSDAHSGLRALRRSALPVLDLRTTGMEFASEMVVKAAKRGLDVREVPIEYRLRAGESKLSPARDAWRHIRFLLVESPTFLFLVPGVLLFVVGFAVLLTLSGGPVELFGRRWEIHSAIVASILTLVGSQIVQLGLFARTYAVLYLAEADPLLEHGWRRLRLEHGLAIGATTLLAGLVVLGYVVVAWIRKGFGNLHEEHLSVVALTLIGLGVQIVFASFFLSVLSLRPRAEPPSR
jgi:glycosyltransferase involved in cell wall biosynthesis